MCDNRRLEPLPDWMVGSIIPIRCIPPLGIHERCEHDRERPAPTIRDLEETIRQGLWMECEAQ
jgi:hypothetical protein